MTHDELLIEGQLKWKSAVVINAPVRQLLNALIIWAFAISVTRIAITSGLETFEQTRLKVLGIQMYKLAACPYCNEPFYNSFEGYLNFRQKHLPQHLTESY